MRNAFYILLLLCLVSCVNEANKSESVAADVVEAYETIDLDMSSISFEQTASQKLQEYFDLLQLQEQHPEFEEDISLQLKEFSKDSSLNFKLSEGFSIDNIHQEGAVEQETDSIKKLKLMFDVVSGQNRIKDSIYALITSKSIELDGRKTLSNKITFLRID